MGSWKAATSVDVRFCYWMKDLPFVEQASVRVRHRGRALGEFRMDLVVEGIVPVEVKAVRALEQGYDKPVFSYLKAANIEVSLLFNFGPKPRVKRFLLENHDKIVSCQLAGASA